jgi:hypothetical protein
MHFGCLEKLTALLLRSPYLLELHLVLCGGDRSTAGQKASELIDNSCLQRVEVTQDA